MKTDMRVGNLLGERFNHWIAVYTNVRDNVLASMKRGIEYTLKDNMIQLDGDRYKLLEIK